MNRTLLRWRYGLICAVLTTQTALAQDNGFVINVQEGEIRDFVREVSTITGKSFVIDPRVSGNISVVSERPLNPDQVYDVFLQVLRAHGYGVVEHDGSLSIRQLAQVKQNAGVEDPTDASLTIVTRVFSLKHIDANEVLKVWRNLIPPHAFVGTILPANLIVVSDHKNNIERLSEVLKEIDVVPDVIIEVVHLQNSWVADVVAMLQNLLPDLIGQQGNRALHVDATVDERTNSLILRGQKETLAPAVRLVKKLDIIPDTQERSRVFMLDHVDAEEIVTTLTEVITPESAASQQESTTTIASHPARNAVVVRGTPRAIAEVGELIGQLDISKPQVLIEAAIVEFTFSNVQTQGADFAIGDNEGDATPALTTALTGVVASILSTAEGVTDIAAEDLIASAASPSLAIANLDPDGVSFGAIIQALAESSSANVLSTPFAMALDNTQAMLQAGQNVPFRTGTVSSRDAGGAFTPISQTTRGDIGVTLTVTPHIHEDRSVRLEVSQENSTIAPQTLGIGDTGFADIVTEQRKVETTTVVQDRQTIVLGGLIQDSIVESDRSVPGLSRIPLLGRLFQTTSRTNSRSHLAIFIRPTVVASPTELDDVTARAFDRVWTVRISATEGESEATGEPTIDMLYEDLSQ